MSPACVHGGTKYDRAFFFVRSVSLVSVLIDGLHGLIGEGWIENKRHRGGRKCSLRRKCVEDVGGAN